MTAQCHPLPAASAKELLELVTRAICIRGDESPAQGESRTRQMVHTVLGFEPRDGLEYMLATMVFGHFNLILDSMRDVFQGQIDTMKLRTKSSIVALDRALIAMLRELRTEQRRPLAQEARHESQSTQPVTATPAPRPEPPAPLAAHPEAQSGAIGPNRAGLLAGTAVQRQACASHPAPPARSGAASLQPVPTLPGLPGGPPIGKSVLVTASPAAAPTDPGEGTLEEHIAAFEQALVDAKETLELSRTPEGMKPRASPLPGT